MDKRSCVIAALAVIFSVLSLTFYKVERDEFECASYLDCIHFCSSDSEKYPDSLAKHLMNIQESPWEFHMAFDSEIEPFKVVRGNLKCFKTETYKDSEFNTSTDYFNIDQNNIVQSLNFPEKYCIEFLNEIDEENGSRPWILHQCKVNHTARKSFHGFGKKIIFKKN